MKENGESDRKKEARASLEDKLYDEYDKTKMVAVRNGFVAYCKHFKYLGSWVSFNLGDDHDIDTRITSVSKAMDALEYFFSRREINIYLKYFLFMAILVNLLLWGCESWAFCTDLPRKLERFVNRKVRKIININLWRIKKYRITTVKRESDLTTFQVWKP